MWVLYVPKNSCISVFISFSALDGNFKLHVLVARGIDCSPLSFPSAGKILKCYLTLCPGSLFSVLHCPILWLGIRKKSSLKKSLCFGSRLDSPCWRKKSHFLDFLSVVCWKENVHCLDRVFFIFLSASFDPKDFVFGRYLRPNLDLDLMAWYPNVKRSFELFRKLCNLFRI